jgi:hypothetical protein
MDDHIDRMTTPWGACALARFPEDPRDRLRAWDASDEYLLRQLAEQDTPLSGTVVIVGDRWGALATALAEHSPVQITDSFLTQEATRANLARNEVDADSVRLLTTQDPPPERVDVLLVRVPRSLALLEDQLLRLAPAVLDAEAVRADPRPDPDLTGREEGPADPLHATVVGACHQPLAAQLRPARRHRRGLGADRGQSRGRVLCGAPRHRHPFLPPAPALKSWARQGG